MDGFSSVHGGDLAFYTRGYDPVYLLAHHLTTTLTLYLLYGTPLRWITRQPHYDSAVDVLSLHTIPPHLLDYALRFTQVPWLPR